MLPKIVVTPNYFPSTWCNNVNSWMMDNVPADPSFGKTGVRRCDVRFLSANMKPYEGVFKSLIDYTKANVHKLNIDIDYQIDGAIQHITYLSGHGVGWHDDTMSYKMALNNAKYNNLKTDRKLSLTVMLSDPTEYQGGDFVFEPGYPLPAKVEGKGTVALFTSYTQHKVEQITSGVRNILFIFITGPTWK